MLTSAFKTKRLTGLLDLIQLYKKKLHINFHHLPKLYIGFNEVWIVVNTSPFTCIHSNIKYWIQYVRQGIQGSSTSVEY